MHTALLVIDVQRALFEQKTPIYRADQLLAAVQGLIARAHEAGVLVVYVQHSNERLLIKGSEGWQLHPQLCPQAEDLLIQKLHGSAFEDTPLAEELGRRGITTVVIAGLVTHGCVKATALDARKHGYATTVAADAHSSYSRDAGSLIETWNARFAEQGITVLPSDEIRF